MHEEKSQGFFNVKFLTFFAFLIFLVILIPFVKNKIKENRVNQEILVIKENISKLQSRDKEFKELIKYFQSDQYEEEKARLNFGLKKRGEDVIVVKDLTNNIEEEAGETNEVSDLSNPILWIYYFFGN